MILTMTIRQQLQFLQYLIVLLGFNLITTMIKTHFVLVPHSWLRENKDVPERI